MKQTGRDFLIGLTALLGAIGVIGTLVLFGEVVLSKPTGYPITLRLNQAEGLTPGGPVTMNGVRVGKITELATAADPRDGVEIRILMEEGVRVPRDVSVMIARDLVGDARLSLTAIRRPGEEREAGFIEPGETVEATAKGLLDQISGLLDTRLEAVERAADSFTELAGTYRRVGERLEGYLEVRSIEEVDAGAPASLAATLARLDRTLSEADAWLGDEALRSDVRSTIDRTNQAISKVAETVDEWGETARVTRDASANIEQRIVEATIEIQGVTTRMDAAAGELQAILASANRGTGTVAQLLNNPDLYNSIVDASRRIERAVFEAQLLLEKYRKEGIPIQF